MSALDFPLEVTAMMMKKLRLVDLLRLYNSRSEFSKLRCLKALEKSMGTITVSQLCQLHAEFSTTDQKNRCFHKQVLDRLEKDTFNGFVHLYMKPENEEFFSNNKILETYGNKLVLVREPDMIFSEEWQISGGDFWNCFEKLVEKIEAEERFLKVRDVDVNFNGQNFIDYLIKRQAAPPLNWRERFLFYFLK